MAAQPIVTGEDSSAAPAAAVAEARHSAARQAQSRPQPPHLAQATTQVGSLPIFLLHFVSVKEERGWGAPHLTLKATSLSLQELQSSKPLQGIASLRNRFQNKVIAFIISSIPLRVNGTCTWLPITRTLSLHLKKTRSTVSDHTCSRTAGGTVGPVSIPSGPAAPDSPLPSPKFSRHTSPHTRPGPSPVHHPNAAGGPHHSPHHTGKFLFHFP